LAESEFSPDAMSHADEIRGGMIISLVILLAGSAAEIASQKWQDWLGAAVLVRLGVGLAQSILITYVSELAPFQLRGAFLGLYQVLLTTGQLIVAIAAQLIQTQQPTKWRPLIAIEFLFTGVSSVLPSDTSLTQYRCLFLQSGLFLNHTSSTHEKINTKKPNNLCSNCTGMLLDTIS
jgi:MFS family permease